MSRWLISLGLLCAVLYGAWFVLAQPFVTPIASKPPAVDAKRLEAHVRMLSHTLYPRSFDQADKLDAAATYIHDELAKVGARPQDQPVTVEGATYRNVVARFGPNDVCADRHRRALRFPRIGTRRRKAREGL